MLIDEIKARILSAMKNGNKTEKEILRVALGEIQTNDARGNGTSDEAVLLVVKKLLKSNEETLALTADETQKAALNEEITILKSLLPKSLDVAGIEAILAPVRDAIRSAANDGQATGVAMKHLKTTGAATNGKDVAEAVKKIRA